MGTGKRNVEPPGKYSLFGAQEPYMERAEKSTGRLLEVLVYKTMSWYAKE